MKLLLVTSVFPSPLQPNTGAFNATMIRGLGAPEDVKVVAPIPWPVAYRARRMGQRLPGTRQSDGIEVRHPVYYYPPKLLRRHYGAFFEWSIGPAIADLVRTFRPQLVLGYWSHPDGQAAVRIAQRLGVPGVVMVGGTDVLVLGRARERQRAIRWVLDQADAIVAVSHDLKRTLGTWGLNTGKIHVVHRGVDTTRFSPATREDARARLGISPAARALLWVGHMVSIKGLETLIDACANAAALIDFHLYLVGDGVLRHDLQRQAQLRGIADRVTFLGYVPHAELADWYRAANVTVLPSHSEGVPNVLLESIACGTPFVASRVGGIPEIADPLVDRLVPPGDAVALAQAIVSALVAPSRLQRKALPISSSESGHRLRGVLASAAASHFRTSPDAAPTVGATTNDPAEVQS